MRAIAIVVVLAACFRDVAHRYAIGDRTRIVVAPVRVPEPCTTPRPPGVPLEQADPDPHDGADHDRIDCAGLDPWQCEVQRLSAWSFYGWRAKDYIEEIRAACARKEDDEP